MTAWRALTSENTELLNMTNSSEKPCWAATWIGACIVARLATGTASIAWTVPEVMALVRVVSSGRICHSMDLARAGRGPE